MEEPAKDDNKETLALDYRFGVRVKDDKKQKVNLYELGGGRNFASMLAAPLNATAIAQTSVCIVADLSRPGNVMGSLQFWLNVVREHIQKAIEQLATKNPEALA